MFLYHLKVHSKLLTFSGSENQLKFVELYISDKLSPTSFPSAPTKSGITIF